MNINWIPNIKIALTAGFGLLAMACGNQSTVDQLPGGIGSITLSESSIDWTTGAIGGAAGCSGVAARNTVDQILYIYTKDKSGTPVGDMDINISTIFTANNPFGALTLIQILDNGVDVSTVAYAVPYETTTNEFGIKQLTIRYDVTADLNCTYFGEVSISSGSVFTQMEFTVSN